MHVFLILIPQIFFCKNHLVRFLKLVKLNLDEFSSNVSINAYDINGKLIENIYLGSLNSGSHTFNWKPVDISSGKYFIRFESHNMNDVIEIIYLK